MPPEMTDEEKMRYIESGEFLEDCKKVGVPIVHFEKTENGIVIKKDI